MKPPPFDYQRPSGIAEAAALLAEHGADAKLLAGGQSLVPLLNFRMLRPSVLIDLNRLVELEFIRQDAGALRIGALARHHAIETSPLLRQHFPIVAAAMAHVGHLAIRNRGTIGGSLAHADPSAELPMLVLLLDATIRARSARGERTYTAGEFFIGPLTTALADDEILTAVELPSLPPGAGWGFEEVALRHGDFAIAAVAAVVTATNETIGAVRLAAMGVGETPLRLRAAEAMLAGHSLTPELIDAAARQARQEVEPHSDLRGSADYRRHLVGVLMERALSAAWERAA